MKNTDEPRMERPGGMVLTRRMIEFSGLKPGDSILDVGCGCGASVEYLLGLGYDAKGIDPKLQDTANWHLPICRGQAEDLPCGDSELDGILCECTFSLFARPVAVLSEFNRTLKPGGALLISDLYARRPQKNILDAPLGTKNFLALLRSSGFKTEHFEDHSDLLYAMYAQMILDSEEDRALCGLPFGVNELKRAKCGYFLLTARLKEKKERQNA